MEFTYKGAKYEAIEADVDDIRFVLPDGTLLEATSFTEDAHIPLTFIEIPYAEVSPDLKELANRFEAVLCVVAEH
jgi:hypothetical protein